MLTLTLIGCLHGRINAIDADRLAVRGIPIGSPREAILVLGDPQTRETGHDDEYGKGDWETLRWPGLAIQLVNGNAAPRVAEITITDRSHATAIGLRVGDTANDVRRILGTPERVVTDDGPDPYWYYLTARFDGHVVVTFRGDRVIEIRVAEDWS